MQQHDVQDPGADEDADHHRDAPEDDLADEAGPALEPLEQVGELAAGRARTAAGPVPRSRPRSPGRAPPPRCRSSPRPPRRAAAPRARPSRACRGRTRVGLTSTSRVVSTKRRQKAGFPSPPRLRPFLPRRLTGSGGGRRCLRCFGPLRRVRWLASRSQARRHSSGTARASGPVARSGSEGTRPSASPGAAVAAHRSIK